MIETVDKRTNLRKTYNRLSASRQMKSRLLPLLLSMLLLLLSQLVSSRALLAPLIHLYLQAGVTLLLLLLLELTHS